VSPDLYEEGTGPDSPFRVIDMALVGTPDGLEGLLIGYDVDGDKWMAHTLDAGIVQLMHAGREFLNHTEGWTGGGWWFERGWPEGYVEPEG
jgi:hypothetical protein